MIPISSVRSRSWETIIRVLSLMHSNRAFGRALFSSAIRGMRIHSITLLPEPMEILWGKFWAVF